MSGFNMPPGVSPRDIPGNDEPSLSEEEARSDEILTALEERQAEDLEEIRKLIGRLSAERDGFKSTNEDLRLRIQHLEKYATHHPSCAKARSWTDEHCDCGLEEN